MKRLGSFAISSKKTSAYFFPIFNPSRISNERLPRKLLNHRGEHKSFVVMVLYGWWEQGEREIQQVTEVGFVLPVYN